MGDSKKDSDPIQQLNLFKGEARAGHKALASSIAHIREDDIAPMKATIAGHSGLIHETNMAGVKSNAGYQYLIAEVESLKIWKSKAILTIIGLLFMLLMEAVGLLVILSRGP